MPKYYRENTTDEKVIKEILVNKAYKKKKINFNLWYDVESLLLLKMSYEKLGKWEYRLKNHAFY